MAYPAITSYTWDFGDGTTSTEQNPLHVYSSPGLYIVTLTIENTDGDTDSTTFTIHAHEVYSSSFGYSWSFGDGGASSQQNPENIFISVGQYNAALTISDSQGRSDTRRFPIKAVGGPPPISWLWSFGDGRTSALQNPEHSFFPGIYDISLAVADADGNQVTVSSPGMITVDTFQITTAPLSGEAPLTVQFRIVE